MRIEDIPDTAFTAPPTPLPEKVVYDWEQLHHTLNAQGFIIIESDQLRTTKTGLVECVPVKSFNTYLRITKKIRLKTKRITTNRWFCTL